MSLNRTLLLAVSSVFVFASCVGHGEKGHANDTPENHKAEKMFQGIWLYDDAGDVAFKVKGDTIFYPDTTSVPVPFSIFADTLVLQGAKCTKYPIVRQTAHIFEFTNQNGEQVKLVRSEDKNDNYFFEGKKVRPLNQNQLIKRDSVLAYGEDKFHCYVQVNPTTYKVVRSTFNDDGVAVDNIYHDNIIHLSVFKGAQKVYSGDFRKGDFGHCVPSDFLDQAILSDLLFSKIDAAGIHYVAVLVIGDSEMSYEVDVTVGFGGKMSLKVL